MKVTVIDDRGDEPASHAFEYDSIKHLRTTMLAANIETIFTSYQATVFNPMYMSEHKSEPLNIASATEQELDELIKSVGTTITDEHHICVTLCCS